MAITSVKASLIIKGLQATNTAAAVTAALEMEPTESHEFGDPHPSVSLAARGRTRANSVWILDEPQTFTSDEDRHGMQSLVRLAERFEPHAEALARLSAEYEICVDLYGFSDSSQGGLWIEPDTMRRLGLLNAHFQQAIYFNEPE